MKPEKLTTIKKLKTLLWDCEQFILTGSTVVELQGLTNTSTDIDIILVNPTEDVKRLISKFVEASPARPDSVKLMEKGIYSFFENKIKVDVFFDTQKYDASLNYDGIILSPLMPLVAAKKSFHRLKDLLQLKAWAAQFYKPENLDQDLANCLLREDY